MNQFKGEPFQARLEKLNQQKDFLHRLNQIIPWEEFRPFSDIVWREDKNIA